MTSKPSERKRSASSGRSPSSSSARSKRGTLLGLARLCVRRLARVVLVVLAVGLLRVLLFFLVGVARGCRQRVRGRMRCASQSCPRESEGDAEDEGTRGDCFHAELLLKSAGAE